MTVRLGLQTLYLHRTCGLCVALFIEGFLGLTLAAQGDSPVLTTGSILIPWAVVYQLAVGTVCYSLLAKLSTHYL